MDDISDDTKVARRHAEITSVVRRRRWSDAEKGRIVAEAIAPCAVIADVARRHDLAPQQLSNWIRAAKEGQFALPADEMQHAWGQDSAWHRGMGWQLSHRAAGNRSRSKSSEALD